MVLITVLEEERGGGHRIDGTCPSSVSDAEGGHPRTRAGVCVGYIHLNNNQQNNHTLTASTGKDPAAVSPLSMTQSVPSSTALATSVASARVGRGFLIMLSNICAWVIKQQSEQVSGWVGWSCSAVQWHHNHHHHHPAETRQAVCCCRCVMYVHVQDRGRRGGTQQGSNTAHSLLYCTAVQEPLLACVAVMTGLPA